MIKILAIDDDYNFIRTIEKFLNVSFSDCEFHYALDGKEGYEKATKIIPEIILLDILLPGMNGYEVCKKLKDKKETKEIPVIFLSAIRTDAENKIKALESGADALLLKPVDQLALVLQVKAMLKLNEVNRIKAEENIRLEKLVKVRTDKLNKELEKRYIVEKELEQKELLYESLVEGSPDILYIFSSKKGATFWSKRVESILGFSADDLLKNPYKWNESIHKDDVKKVNSVLENMTKGNLFDIEYRIKDTKGNWHWFRDRGISKNTVEDEIIIHGLASDITKQKELELEQLKNEKELQNLNSTKDKFFSIIAHDLKSPFNSILGFSDLILENSLAKDYDQMELMSRMLNKAAKQSFDLLNNLLEWSRTQRGKSEFNPDNYPLCDIVNGTVNILNLVLAEKNIKIKNNCPEIFVHGDYNMLESILRNLISNAIKYSFENGEIIISATEKENETEINVSDNGVGISEENKAKIFNIGEDISTFGTNNEKGTGLGLILCKEFVKTHKGKIWFESEEGKGSTFYVSLPKMEI